MKIPWRSISSTPVEVEIEGLIFVISPISQNEWIGLNQPSIKEKEEELKEWITETLKNINVI